jgi:CRP-like cAMP-binding protein
MSQGVDAKVLSFFQDYPEKAFRKGELLIRADEDPAGVFYLQEGIVRQYYISRTGIQITLNMFKAGAFFPMSWVISDIHNNYYFEAVTSCQTYKIPKPDMLAFIKKEPEVLFDLLRRVFVGIEGLWLHIEYLSAGNSATKLVSTIIILAERFGKQTGDSMIIDMGVKLTEKELGDYAGMYRETVSREMQLLEKNNLVLRKNGTIVIPDFKKLEACLTL